MGGSSVNLNAGANQQNWRQFETNEDKNIDFEAKAKAIAQMIYGSGKGEAENGGAGHIGLIGNKVLKFNTKWNERLSLKKDSIAYQDMKESCNNLREELKAMANVAGLKGGELKKLLATLGFKEDGSIDDKADLLKRTTAADALKTLVAAFKDKMQTQTKLTIAEVWEGHTPTYGNSAESFRKTVNAHNSDIFTYIQNERTALADKVVEDCDNSADAARRMADGVKQNFVKYCNTLEKWLKKTNTFFLGLVPANPHTKGQLMELKARMKAQTEGADEGKTIVGILAKLKKYAEGEDTGSYVLPDFDKEFKTFEELMKAGLEEVVSRFDAMLTDLSKVKFADGSNYPDLLRDLKDQKIPKEFRPIAEDLASLAFTFKKAVSEFSEMGTHVEDVERYVNYKTWNSENEAKVDKAVQDFNGALENLNKAKRNPAGATAEDWKTLAKALVKMRNAIYHAEAVGRSGNKMNMFFELFDNAKTLMVRRKIEDAEIDGVNNEGTFKSLVMSLISTSKGGIFWSEEKTEDREAPRAILNKHNPIPGPETNGYKKHRGIMYQTSMKYFKCLYDLASTFKLIDSRDAMTFDVKELLKTDEAENANKGAQ